MRVLMIYIEPAPYILDLIRVLHKQHPDLELRVLFITSSATQSWGAMPKIEGVGLLPSDPKLAHDRIRETISDSRFDWLHLAGWGHPMLKVALRLGRVARLRISMESDTQAPFKEPTWKRLVKATLYPHMFSRVDLFFPGGSRQRHYLQQFGIPESKIRIAQMTVDVDRIVEMATEIRAQRSEIRSGLGFNDADTLFVFVGRLEPYKGVELLLESFGYLGHSGVGLLIVGDGSCRSLVEQAAADDDCVHYAGRRDFDGVIEAFAISDVAVVPSTFEPWGLVVNEALAAGLPVIASNRVGAVDDLVTEGETGMVFPSGDAVALAKAMRRLGEDAALREDLAHSGCKRIVNWNLAATADILHRGWNDGC